MSKRKNEKVYFNCSDIICTKHGVYCLRKRFVKLFTLITRIVVRCYNAKIKEMKMKKMVALIYVVCAIFPIFAQTTYKGVTLDRGKDSETNCIYIFNDNDDSVRVIVQYKIGNRNTNWIDYPINNLIPPSIDVAQKIGCVDSTIIGLNLVDVKIVKKMTIKVDKKTTKNKDTGFFQKIKSWFLDL